MLLAGRHARGHQDTNNLITIMPGEIFETISEKEADFCRKYPDRYQEVRSEVYPPIRAAVKPVTPSAPEETVVVNLEELAKMNVMQLLSFCRQNGIDLKGATSKDKILEAIKNAASEG